MRANIWVLALLVLLTSCASQPLRGEREAVLFNPVIHAGSLEVSVLSFGCTQADDFYLKVVGAVIELRRHTPDTCRTAPQLIRLAIPFAFSAQAYQFKNDIRFSDRSR